MLRLAELLGSAAYDDDDETDDIAVPNVTTSTSSSHKGQGIGRHFTIAKSLFDCHEYSRCAALLDKSLHTDSKSVFLRLYARYLVRLPSLSRIALICAVWREEPGRGGRDCSGTWRRKN